MRKRPADPDNDMRRNPLIFFLLLLLPHGISPLLNAQEEPADGLPPEIVREKIKVSVPEGQVIPGKQRNQALAIGQHLLDTSPENLSAIFEELKTPFLFPKPKITETVEAPDDTTDPTPILTGAPKDDMEVLRILAPRLQREVQGSMILGERRRLIWSNGNSVRIGYIFKTRIDETDPNLYEITISDIQTKTFSIKLNETEIPIPVGDTARSGGIQPGN